MKRLILLIVTLAAAATRLFAAHLCPSTGRVVDEQGKAVEYATVVLLKGTEQVAGMATDAEGRFALKAAPGEYTLLIQYLGFDPVKKPVRVEQENHLGDFVMRTSATGIESVEVKARLVRREADRFVVDVANAPAAIGKDGIELLERAPGVWIDGEKISINGKSGSKVYVNDRELRMEPEQLLTYLRSLRAEEIQKIEVVPTSGADYDADSAGGIIRITLKKRRENGVNGSVAFNTTQGEIVHRYNPSANINLHSGRVDFYASAWGSFGKDETTTGEQTRYEAADKELNAHSSMKGRNRSLGTSAGAVVEIDGRNSVGAEFEYWRNRNGEPNDTYTDFRNAGTVTRTDSHFDKLDIRNNYSATFNYIRKIDTLGSTLKLLADYTRRETDSGNDNFSRMTAPGATADSTYRDNTESVYNIATATLALEKRFSPRWTLKAGAKYTYNDMHNDALYEYLKGDAWTRNDNQSFTIDYTENIAAAYAVASAQLGRWGLVAGLRGEYTHTTGKSVGQDYFSLFPNANVSFALSKEKGWSLIAQYARTIERPRFWCLNPQRMQISDYTYYSATFNYIRKIDTLGSTLKLLADYTRRETDSGNDNFSRMTAPGATADSTYRDNTESVYNIATATLALEKRFSPRWTLKAGAKYTYNDMHNDALYEYLKGDAWTRNDNQSFTIDYTENIAAAYAVASAQLGRWGLVAGLRGEYTHTTGKSVGQDYFSLFPNANVSFALSKEKGWSLIAQYARTIERPRFWCLNPQRMQISDYTYQTGNPSLDPAFKQDVNLTLVAAHKYTLTAGVQLVSGEIQQTIQADPENPDLLQLAWVNYDRTKNYYVSVNLPFQPAKWWQLNANFTYMRHGERVEQHGAETFYNWAFGSISTTFTLPAKFYIDLSYNYQSRIDLGNCWVLPDHRLQAGVKKRFGDRFTASFSVQNLLDQGQVIGAHGDGFVRTMNARQTWSNRSFRIGLTYNFKSGKAFKRKAVEAGSADEKSRL